MLKSLRRSRVMNGLVPSMGTVTLCKSSVGGPGDGERYAGYCELSCMLGRTVRTSSKFVAVNWFFELHRACDGRERKRDSPRVL